MGTLVLGLILALFGWLLPWPAPIGTVLLVIGIVFIAYGLLEAAHSRGWR